ncbi:MAG: hypothetical protein O3C62_11735 [Actinomycetota bacterium]|nr:hypothetical protein [Actinomycetota bacterium]MDA2971435.1 hypothetical protein [Actinomycetota bacterium]MDA3002332.1 hypothetical protein [Actinomycetota bacterium]
MSRRAPLALILALSTATTAVACGSSDSTPTSTPSSTVATVDLRSDSFTLSADRREGLTVLSEGSSSISVEIPDKALPSGVDSADITATVNRLTATDVGTAIELCLEVSERSYGGVKSDKGAEVVEDGFRKCTTDNFTDLTMPTTCDGTGQGFMQGMSTAYFGLAGLSPFALLIVLAGGDVQSQATAFSQSDSWASASKALLFIRRKFDQNIPCAPPTTMSTAMSTTTMTDSDTPLAQPTTTVRSGTSGSPSRTTTLAPTTTTAPSTTTTTTTIKATTTTRPRAGATTTLPRPTPGGTTTLP